jgi:outer membrane protein OmpA-like peptidoglycan-associated protein
MCNHRGQRELELLPEFEKVLSNEYRVQSESTDPSVNNIKWVQQSLNKIMRLRLTEDGIMGSATKSALRAYQGKRGLKATGSIDQTTISALANDQKMQTGSLTATTPLIPPTGRVRKILNERPIHVINSKGKSSVINDDADLPLTKQCSAAIILDRFTLGEYQLRFSHYNLLINAFNILQSLAGLQDFFLVVEGHADKSGNEDRNAGLS